MLHLGEFCFGWTLPELRRELRLLRRVCFRGLVLPICWGFHFQGISKYILETKWYKSLIYMKQGKRRIPSAQHFWLLCVCVCVSVYHDSLHFQTVFCTLHKAQGQRDRIHCSILAGRFLIKTPKGRNRSTGVGINTKRRCCCTTFTEMKSPRSCQNVHCIWIPGRKIKELWGRTLVGGQV